MNQKTFLSILPGIFLLCSCVFLVSLYYFYTRDKQSDFFNASEEVCNYKDEELGLDLNYSCDWNVYNDGISYIDKEYNDTLIKDTLHFFKGDDEVLVQVFNANPTGSYFILNQDYTFEEINDKMIIYKKENYDLYRYAEKYSCDELEKGRYVFESDNLICGKTMIIKDSLSLLIRSNIKSDKIISFVHNL
ncbi:hypothetical protein KC669_00380 [Candidatus Dojkabacteria bacterium]|uniref:Uncharacterized protein n=1 Tax=Candidatus Dojkabacteria bacterium TaxID=2099670 RepID=A0A955RL91_9BACT|nr:hypothetical protein [Candidatus Dojkabacteria bacterium]